MLPHRALRKSTFHCLLIKIQATNTIIFIAKKYSGTFNVLSACLLLYIKLLFDFMFWWSTGRTGTSVLQPRTAHCSTILLRVPQGVFNVKEVHTSDPLCQLTNFLYCTPNLFLIVILFQFKLTSIHSSLVNKYSCARCVSEYVSLTSCILHTKISELAGRSHRTGSLLSARSPTKYRCMLQTVK